MSKEVLGIIGGGQLGSMIAAAAKKLNIKTIVFCDDPDAPAQNFLTVGIYGKYNDNSPLPPSVDKVDLVTFEFENIPFETFE